MIGRNYELSLAFAIIEIDQENIKNVFRRLKRFSELVEIRIVLTNDDVPFEKILFKYKVTRVDQALEVIARIRKLQILRIAWCIERPRTPEEIEQLWPGHKVSRSW